MIREGSTITMSIEQYDELEKKEEAALAKIAGEKRVLHDMKNEIQGYIKNNCVAVENRDDYLHMRGAVSEISALRYKYSWYMKSYMIQEYEKTQGKRLSDLKDREKAVSKREKELTEMSFFTWLKLRRE